MKKKRKIDTIEKLAVLMAEGFEQVDKRFEQVDIRLDRIELRLERIESELADIHRRIERLEEQGASNAGFAKEIDTLLRRVNNIEKHLGIKQKAAA